jgi:hypothetical protein
MNDFKTPRALPSIQVSWQWLAIISFVIMEASWVVPWVQSTNASIASVRQGTILLTSAGIVLCTTVVMRIAAGLGLNQQIRRALLGVCLIIGLYAGNTFLISSESFSGLPGLSSQRVTSFADFLNQIPAWFWVSVIVILLWWRGLWLSKERLGPMLVFDYFRVGIIMFGLFSLVGFLVPLAKAINPTIMIFTFLCFGLISLISSRVSIMGVLRGGGRSPFDRRWLLAVGISTLCFVLVAYGIATITTGQAAIFFGLIGGFLLLVGILLASPILLLVYLFTPAIERTSDLLPTPASTPDFLPLDGATAGELNSSGSFLLIEQSQILSPELRGLLLLLGMLIVIIFLIWSVRWITSQNKAEKDGFEREFLLENKDLLKVVREKFQNRLKTTSDSMRGNRRLSADERQRAAEHIRVIYSNLLELTHDLGFPRQVSVTPLEYQSELKYIFAENEIDLELITRAYLAVRYGEMPETENDIRMVNEAWLKIQEQAKTIKKLQNKLAMRHQH